MASRASGFTLVEVLVALVVLMTAASGVAALTTVAMHARSLARQKTIVALLGAREVESVRAGLLGPSGIEYFDASGQSLGSVFAGRAVFLARWQSSPAPSDASTSLVRVRVSPVGSVGPAPPLGPSGAPNVMWLVATVRPAS